MLPIVLDDAKKEILEALDKGKHLETKSSTFELFETLMHGQDARNDEVFATQRGSELKIENLHEKTKAIVLSHMGNEASQQLTNLSRQTGPLTDD